MKPLSVRASSANALAPKWRRRPSLIVVGGGPAAFGSARPTGVVKLVPSGRAVPRTSSVNKDPRCVPGFPHVMMRRKFQTLIYHCSRNRMELSRQRRVWPPLLKGSRAEPVLLRELRALKIWHVRGLDTWAIQLLGRRGPDAVSGHTRAASHLHHAPHQHASNHNTDIITGDITGLLDHIFKSEEFSPPVHIDSECWWSLRK